MIMQVLNLMYQDHFWKYINWINNKKEYLEESTKELKVGDKLKLKTVLDYTAVSLKNDGKYEKWDRDEFTVNNPTVAEINVVVGDEEGIIVKDNKARLFAFVPNEELQRIVNIKPIDDMLASYGL